MLNFDPLLRTFSILGNTWFIWLPVLLFFIAFSSWLAYIQTRYKKEVEWTLLEIKIPREVRKTPRAMEQILNNIYGLRNAPSLIFPSNWKERYWDGEVTLWFSLEIVSFGGEIHFFIRTPKQHKDIVEANFYAQYPDIEIAEVDDYISRMPKTVDELYKNDYDLAGGELKLGKKEPYPIVTHLQFEAPEEERQLDPVSVIMELLGKIKQEEDIWLQFLIRPTDPAPKAPWTVQCNALIKKLKEAEIREVPTRGSEGETGIMPMMVSKTPRETDVIKACEHKCSKSAFETVIRYLYFSPQSIFDKDFAKRGIGAALNQYSSMDLNFFIGSLSAKTTADWHEFPFFFSKRRTETRKRNLLRKYRERIMPEETFMARRLSSNFFHWHYSSLSFLNTEELATIYHLPSHLVLTAPFVRRVEARKASPPANLPVFEGEE